MDWFTVKLVICAPMPLLILLPLAVYAIVRLCRLANHPFIFTRRFNCTLSLCIVLLIGMVFSYLAPVAFATSHIVYDGCVCILAVVCFCQLGVLNIRAWLLYYQYHFSYYTVQSGWRSVINSSVSDHQNWFIVNNKRYGNPVFVRKFMLTAHLCGAILFGSAAIVRYEAVQNTKVVFGVAEATLVSSLLLLAFFVVLYAVLVCKTPHFQDSYFIHWESKLHSKLSAAMVLVCVGAAIASNFISLPTVVFVTILYQLYGIYYFAMIMVSTLAVISRNQHAQNTAHAVGAEDNNGSIETMSVTLPQILADEFVFGHFMQHLFTEYSTECLLSFIEFNQYEEYILNCLATVHVDIADTASQQESVDVHIFRLHSMVPPSSILQNRVGSASEEAHSYSTNIGEQMVQDVKTKGHRLYKKYIERGCALEINICGVMRHRMKDAFEDEAALLANEMDLLQVLALFESVRQEMHTLLGYSICNFQAKPEFEAVRNYLQKKGRVSYA